MSQINRRDLLKVGALAGVGYWAGGGVALAESKSAIERIRWACVGVGGKGSSDSDDAAKEGDIVGLCDVDESTLNKKAAGHEKARKYRDFRKMLDELEGKVDAVTVSTPDHNHAAAGLMAMRRKMACFCQKPMTRTLYEARLMGEVAKANKVATQMGNQGTANDSLRKQAAMLKAGVIGKVKECHVWTNRPIWPQGGLPSSPKEVPANLDWDLWLGVAKERPYTDGYHAFAWRGWWDFGTGALGDMACHTLNMPYMGLNLRDPLSVQAETSGHNKVSFPKWSVIAYEFGQNGDRAPLTFYWYDGGKKPSRELFDGAEIPGTGALVIGDKGKMISGGDYADGKLTVLGGSDADKVEYKKSPGHFKEFALAVKGGDPAVSNFPDYATGLTETVLLGNLAVWAAPDAGDKGKKVMWDAKNLKTTGTTDFDSYIKPTYRKGYTLDA